MKTATLVNNFTPHYVQANAIREIALELNYKRI